MGFGGYISWGCSLYCRCLIYGCVGALTVMLTRFVVIVVSRVVCFYFYYFVR